MISMRFVDRNNPDALPEPVARAEDWVRDYLNGASDVCWACERALALPEPPPRYHVVVSSAYSLVGGICDACSAKGEDHCLDGVAKHLGDLDASDFIRPHEIHKPGRA